MRIPEPPAEPSGLNLLKRLEELSSQSSPLGPDAREACGKLRSSLLEFVKTVTPLLDRTNAKEMDTFTMHDARHAIKVAHLMWHFLTPERQKALTPPEIGLLVASAYLHDLGMFLSPGEREKRLAHDSDLWERLELDDDARDKFEQLGKSLKEAKDEATQKKLTRQLFAAEEALLCLDTRERHALRERYEEVLRELHAKYVAAKKGEIVDVDACFTFAGDSFRDKLIDICVSHGENADYLKSNDPTDRSRPMFPRNYPVGTSTADLQFVAAALRLADICDFDRERTPATIFYYFLPGGIDPSDNRSILEWGKHMSVAQWEVEKDAIVYRARCQHHVTHHAIVQFCGTIKDEIAATRDTFDNEPWPFILPEHVVAEITAEGYRYLPLEFKLDDERIYKLLMGGAIYDNPLAAVRELVQNAVDACKLRDALTKLDDDAVEPSKRNRIIITYTDPSTDCPYPKLSVFDKGTGMDQAVISKWFLRVGRSYYNSTEFNQYRVQLRKKNLDFAPVSEFGIGFLSSFLLADEVEVETAMWESKKGDTRRRTLTIHGPTKLIRVTEHDNDGAGRFKGTCVTLKLKRSGKQSVPPLWDDIKAYLRRVCPYLTYSLHLRHGAEDAADDELVGLTELKVPVPPEFEAFTVRIQINDTESGLEGEIALTAREGVDEHQRDTMAAHPVREAKEDASDEISKNVLVRGGFVIAKVPGLTLPEKCSGAALSETWEQNRHRRYALTNLSRSAVRDEEVVADHVARCWISWLLENVHRLSTGFIRGLGTLQVLSQSRWLQSFDAYRLFQLGLNGWRSEFGKSSSDQETAIQEWTSGRGERIPLPTGIAGDILEIVLPCVCACVLDPEDRLFFVAPPRGGWIEELRDWKTFVTQPIMWGPLVDFVKDAEFLLWHDSARDLANSRWSKRLLKACSAEDLPDLFASFHAITRGLSNHRQIMLSQRQLGLVRRVQKQLGDLSIAYLAPESWRLDSINLGQ